MKSQNEWVLEQLKAGRRLTPRDALLEIGCTRLGARIFEVKAFLKEDADGSTDEVIHSQLI